MGKFDTKKYFFFNSFRWFNGSFVHRYHFLMVTHSSCQANPMLSDQNHTREIWINSAKYISGHLSILLPLFKYGPSQMKLIFFVQMNGARSEKYCSCLFRIFSLDIIKILKIDTNFFYQQSWNYITNLILFFLIVNSRNYDRR